MTRLTFVIVLMIVCLASSVVRAQGRYTGPWDSAADAAAEKAVASLGASRGLDICVQCSRFRRSFAAERRAKDPTRSSVAPGSMCRTISFTNGTAAIGSSSVFRTSAT